MGHGPSLQGVATTGRRGQAAQLIEGHPPNAGAATTMILLLPPLMGMHGNHQCSLPTFQGLSSSGHF